MTALFGISPGFFKDRIFCGVLYFLALVALAMTRLNPSFILLPAIILAVVSFVVCVSEFDAGYIAVALSVCKNE